MDRISLDFILKATGGELISGARDSFVCGVAIDSRKIETDYLFVAIAGENTDGHAYIDSASEKGASCALVSKDVEAEGISLVKVPDTVRALQELSKEYLKTLPMKHIAVTGSVGKTTTRDLLYAAVSSVYKAGKNSGNFNNEIGLPLTIMSFDKTMNVGVMEMGTMGTLGEIDRLADIGRPDVAIITNIGVSHMETLGSRDNILKTKLEITDYFTEDNALIVNVDDDKLSSLDEKDYVFRIIKVGTEKALKKPDYLVTKVKDNGLDGTSFTLSAGDEKYDVVLPIPGEHNALNAALAIAGAKEMGVSIVDAISGISNMVTTGSRLRIVDVSGFRIIDDSYNAAPASMKAAIKTLVSSDAKRRIAVLGDMNELGTESKNMHFDVGRFVAESKIDVLVTVGKKALWIAEGAEEALSDEDGLKSVIRCTDAEEAFMELKEILKEGDLVLVKASRSMKLDELVKQIESINILNN